MQFLTDLINFSIITTLLINHLHVIMNPKVPNEKNAQMGIELIFWH